MYCYVSLKFQSFVYTQLNDQTVLFQTIQFRISHLFTLSLNVKRFYSTLSGATTPSQSGPGSNSNEEVLRIPQNSSITAGSPLGCLMSYPGHLLWIGVLNYSKHAVGVVIYEALCFDVAQGRMNGAPNETRTHSCRFASLACSVYSITPIA